MLTKPVRDEYVIADEVTLHYVQWGENGPPVVCTHGLTANAYCFQALADELAADHRVIAYDLRGRGDSDRPEEGYSIPIYAHDLAELLTELELERPVLVGHSSGALVSLYLAAHRPDILSKLVLIDAGAPYPWLDPQDQPAWLTTSINRLGTPIRSFGEYIRRLQALPALGEHWNQYFDLYFKHDVRINNDNSVIAKAYREGILEEGTHFREALPEEQWAYVTVPTLLLRAGSGIFSDNDVLIPEEWVPLVLKGIRDCRYVNFPTLNHYTILFGVEPGPAQEIRAFIDR